MAMLEIKDLEVNYGIIKAIKGINLEVNKGEIVALIGANGAGKTTVLQTIAGLIKPKAGKIMFNGKDISKIPAHKMVYLKMAEVPEGRRIFQQLSVKDNLLLGSFSRKAEFSEEIEKGIEEKFSKIKADAVKKALKGVYKLAKAPALKKKQINETLEEVYVKFPILKEREKQIAGTLSGGEQQMLAMGRALMSKPEIILMDEPSMGLSPLYASEIFATVVKLWEGGATVLLVEQNAKKALSIANRAYVLETGNIVLSGDAQEMMNNPEIKKAYLAE